MYTIAKLPSGSLLYPTYFKADNNFHEHSTEM